MYDENGMEVQDGEDFDEIPSGEEGSGRFSDIERTCKDCGSTFIFSSGEQDFYERNHLNNPPKRCKDCRNKNKSGFNSYQGDQDKNETICSKCGEKAFVNFVPTPGREVLCNRCFAEKKRSFGYPSKNQDTGYSR